MGDFENLDWHDLRAFGALAEAGSLAGGARRLGVSHSTLLRRLNRLEAHLSAKLVHRHSHGCTLTEEGELVAQAAASMAGAARTLGQLEGGEHAPLRGSLRIAVVEGASALLFPVLVELREQHPGLRFEVVAGDGLVDLKRGDADLALRLAVSDPPPDLVGRRHGRVAFAPYAHRDESVGRRPFKTGRWVVLHRDLAAVPQAVFEAAQIPEERRWLAVGSGRLVHQAVRQGAGRGILPCITGDADAMLRRIGPTIELLSIELWTLYARSAASTRKLRVTRDALWSALDALAPRFAGVPSA